MVLVIALSGGERDDAVHTRIEQLEQEIADLKAFQRRGQWVGHTQLDDRTRAIIADALADAHARSSWAMSPSGAGHDGDFYIQSADGTFVMNVKGQLVFRHVLNHKASADETTSGSEMRRLKLELSGSALSPRLTYKVKASASRSSGATRLDDAWLAWELDDQWSLRGGQFKMPFMREELDASTKAMAVDRSFVNEQANQGKSQGVQLTFERDTARAWIAFSDGHVVIPNGANNDNRNTAFNADGVEYAATARFETLVGDDVSFKQFNDRTSWSDDPAGARLGAAVHVQDSEYGTAADEMSVVQWTVDTAIEFGGASIIGAVVGSHIAMDATPASDFDQIGVVIEGGVHLVPDEWELFGRWETYDFDGAAGAGFSNDVTLVSVGFTRFVHKDRLKFQSDIVWALDPIENGITGIGLLSDAMRDDGQIAWRSQVVAKF